MSRGADRQVRPDRLLVAFPTRRKRHRKGRDMADEHSSTSGGSQSSGSTSAGQQPYGSPGQGQPQYGYGPPAPTNGLAVAGMVFGIIGAVFGLVPFFFWLAGILGLLALIFGAIGLSKANQGQGRKGMAIAGIVLGLVALLLTALQVFVLGSAVNEIQQRQQGLAPLSLVAALFSDRQRLAKRLDVAG